MRLFEDGLHFRSGGLSLVALTYLPLTLMTEALGNWLFGTCDVTTPVGLDGETLPRLIRHVGVRFFGFELAIALPCVATEDWLQVYAARKLARRMERVDGLHRNTADLRMQARTFLDAHSGGRFGCSLGRGKEGETLAWHLERINRELESEEEKAAWNDFFAIQRRRFENEGEK